MSCARKPGGGGAGAFAATVKAAIIQPTLTDGHSLPGDGVLDVRQLGKHLHQRGILAPVRLTCGAAWKRGRGLGGRALGALS